jgi:hypothetical protein
MSKSSAYRATKALKLCPHKIIAIKKFLPADLESRSQ